MADGQGWLSAVFFSFYAKERKVKGIQIVLAIIGFQSDI